MTKSKCIFICRNFTPEVDSAVIAEGWGDVEVIPFPARCGRPPLVWDEVRQLLPQDITQIVLLGSACLRELGDPPPDFPPVKIEKVTQCFNLVAGQKLVDETIVSGGYLITPAWLAEWRDNLKEMGFTPENSDDFFRDFARELVLLDSGLDPMSVANLAELQKTISLETRRIPIGLEHLQLFLSKVFMECRFEKERRALLERERLNNIKLADQAAAMDMLMRLAKIQDEDKSIATIKELFQMLFAPESLYYLKMEHELPAPTQSIPAEMQANMLELHDDYAATPDGRGFILRIEHGDELLGIIAVDQLAFPEYKSRYLNMALAVTGVFALVVSNAREIAERKKAEKEKQVLEKQLVQTQKLESLGVLSGGIAHDFNNILAIIIGYCGLIKMDYDLTEQTVPEIEKAAERAAGLCRQMLAYAGKAKLETIQVDMKMLACEMVGMLKATLSKNAVINFHSSENIPEIIADTTQIRQIVMNLIINASEAIGNEHGEIKVSLSHELLTDKDPAKDYIGKSIPSGNYLCLEVTDTGCGMDEETKWRLFEPFYTTKFAGRGLGMSSVLGIILSHKGALQLHSQLGQGTTFKVYLPALTTLSVNGDSDQAVPALWQGNGTILLVEDEDQVRYIAKAILQKIGFTVLEAVNGKEALEMYQKNAQDIRLVMTDVGMPVMDGYELCAKLKAINSKLPIIISSGFGDAEVSSRIGSDNVAGLNSKPYKPDQLREVLKNICEVSK